jgi:hypothetical protein
VRDERAGEPFDLLVVEELLAREEDVVATEDLLRHAVDAAEVAAIGHRDPKIPQGPVQRVRDHRSKRSRMCFPYGSCGREARMDPEREQVDESRRNPTQERMDEEGTEERPVDVASDNEPSPHEGEEGTEPAA